MQIKKLQSRRAARTVGALAAVATAVGATAAHAQTTSTVTVNAGTPLGTIPAIAFGTNIPVWGSLSIDNATIEGDLNQLGVNVVRYPGGTVSDMFHWQTDSVTETSTTSPDLYLSPFATYANSSLSFTDFMAMVAKTSAVPMITVNYGTNAGGTGPGSASEAAAWVTNANVTNNYGIKYWEIGNEVYGNGEYGAATTTGGVTTYTGNYWEPDLHSLLLPPNPMGTSSSASNIERAGLAALGPVAYATNCQAYVTDMKNADSAIKVGVVLTAPGCWPDASAPGNPLPAWNPGVLQTLQTLNVPIDFVVVHWYPENAGSETDAGLLSSTPSIANMVATLKQEIAQYYPMGGSNVQIFVTETNSVNSTPGKQSVGLVNGLFLPDDIMSWLEAGVQNVDWWSLFNSLDEVYGTTALLGNMSPSLYGTATFGDYGLLSSGTSPEPAQNTPFPSYYSYAMLPDLGHPGDTMVSSSSSSTLVGVHSVTQANGNLAVMLINRDPVNTNTANLSVAGYVPAQTATEYTYGENSTAITSSTLSNTGPTFSTTIAPYSLNTIVMTPAPAPAITASVSIPYTGPSGTIAANTDWIQYAANTAIPITVTYTDTGGPLSNAAVYITVWNPDGQIIVSSAVSGVNFSGYGASYTRTYNWTPNRYGIYHAAADVRGNNGTAYFNSTNLQSLNVGSAAVSIGDAQVLTTPSGSVPVNGVSEPAYVWDAGVMIYPSGYPITAFNSTVTVAPPASGGGLTPYASVCYPAIATCTSSGLTYNCTLNSAVPTSDPSFAFSSEYLLGNTVAHPVSGDTYSLTYTSDGLTFTLNGDF
jgi:hypothetical protein